MSILDALKIGAGAILGAALAIAPAHYLGKREGRQQAATAALEKTVEILQSREKTNAEISASDAAALCAHLGLRDDDLTECMRRVGEAISESRNGGADRD